MVTLAVSHATAAAKRVSMMHAAAVSALLCVAVVHASAAPVICYDLVCPVLANNVTADIVLVSAIVLLVAHLHDHS